MLEGCGLLGDLDLMLDALQKAQHSRKESRIIPNPCHLCFSDERWTTHIGKCSKTPCGILVSDGKDLKDEPWSILHKRVAIFLELLVLLMFQPSVVQSVPQI